MKHSPEFIDLLVPKARPKVTEEIFAIEKRYKRYIKVWKPSIPIEKIKDGYELLGKLLRSPSSDKTSIEHNLSRSVRRTKGEVTDLLHCNDFDQFGTFTFKADRQDIAKCKKKMSTWLDNQQKQHGKFGYVIVPEFHKDGKSIHFHALLKGYKGKLVQACKPGTNQPLSINGRLAYNFLGYKLGHSTVVYVGTDQENQEKTGRYLLKYITKDMITLPGKKRYWASRDLQKPVPIRNPDPIPYAPYYTYPNDYGVIEFYKYPEDQNG